MNRTAPAVPPRTRRGLTLVELIVVLAILVVLGGLIIAKLDGVLSKAHSAQGASAIGELMRFMDTYRAANGRYPDIYDSMLNSGESLTFRTPKPCGILRFSEVWRLMTYVCRD